MNESHSPPSEITFWKRCSSCKKGIPFHSDYLICSVSTCQHKKTGLVFCNLACWDAHLGFANHRHAEALELLSPTKETFEQEVKAEMPGSEPSEPKRKIITTPTSILTASKPMKVETLVVVSKVKDFIKNQSEFNTSQCAIDALTQKVAQECQKAIDHAKSQGRKTVMGRDFS